MDILFVISLILVIIFSGVFIYSFFQDIFNFFIAPVINRHLSVRINILHRMGLYESANFLDAHYINGWLDLLR